MLQSDLRLPKRNVDAQYGSQTQPAQLVCVCVFVCEHVHACICMYIMYVVLQARLLTPAKEESGHHPIHNSYLHTKQIF